MNSWNTWKKQLGFVGILGIGLLGVGTPAKAVQSTCFVVSPTTGLDVPCKAQSDGSLVTSSGGVSGSIGTNRSANTPTGPGAATSFTYNGVTVNLLSTIAANTSRKQVEINNTSGDSSVVLVIDDGANTVATISILPLAPGIGAGLQGGSYSSQVELGRIRIFGTTGDFVYAREN